MRACQPLLLLLSYQVLICTCTMLGSIYKDSEINAINIFLLRKVPLPETLISLNCQNLAHLPLPHAAKSHQHCPCTAYSRRALQEPPGSPTRAFTCGTSFQPQCCVRPPLHIRLSQTVHHSEGTAWREALGVKPTGPNLGKQRENRMSSWLALPGFSRLAMWLQWSEVGTGKEPLKVVMSSSHSKLIWIRPAKQKGDMLTSAVTSKLEL